MKKRKSLFMTAALAAVAMTAFTSCNYKRDNMKKLVAENMRETTEYPNSLQLLSMSEPDSAFGTDYFTRKEITGIMQTMKAVTKTIMVKTNNMQDFNPDNPFIMNLADKQMAAANNIRSIIMNNGKKSSWSGWKIKVDYQAKTKDGIDYKAEKWLFLNRRGNAIIKSFEIPLP